MRMFEWMVMGSAECLGSFRWHRSTRRKRDPPANTESRVGHKLVAVAPKRDKMWIGFELINNKFRFHINIFKYSKVYHAFNQTLKRK